MKAIKLLDKALEKLTTYLLVASVLLMLSLSSLSIVARWFQSNITWIDPFVRHLVFLSAFLGGIIATGQGTHIGIDVIGKFVESKGWHSLRSIISKVIMFSSMLVLCWLIKSGIDFTKVELEFGKIEFFGIHSGFLVMIIPIGMGLLLLRFLTVFILSFGKTNHTNTKVEV
jgi:TRAP-type C4-dicarboxylate transport system permease small subunit